MTERERLIELITEWEHSEGDETGEEGLANHLLKNGVIVPPCKVGDTVYWFCINGAMREAKVTGFGLTSSLKIGFTSSPKKGLDYCIPFTDIGKTVFLTREEAETALRKEDEGK